MAAQSYPGQQFFRHAVTLAVSPHCRQMQEIETRNRELMQRGGGANHHADKFVLIFCKILLAKRDNLGFIRRR
jgi:hypothetical protein